MTAAAPMWLAMMIALDVAGSLDVSDSARVYAREALTSDGVTFDIENVPRAALQLEWPTTTLALEYAPRLFWSDIGGPEASPTLLLHSTAASLTTRRQRLVVSVAQSFMIGDQSFARITLERGPLEAAPPPGIGTPAPPEPSPDLALIPGPTVVEVIAAETSASLHYDWSRRVSTELRPSIGVSGGANTEARLVLPRQRTARIDLALAYRASQRDTLTTETGVEDIWVSTGYDHHIVSLTETWTHAFAPSTGASLGGGVAVQETEVEATSTLDWQPVGMASAWHGWPAGAMYVRVQGALGYRPEVNTLIGTLQQRFYGSAEAALEAGATSVRLALGATQTFPLERIDTAQSASAELVVEQALLTWLSADVGGQLVWQSLGDDSLLVASESYWLLFAGARAELPTVRF